MRNAKNLVIIGLIFFVFGMCLVSWFCSMSIDNGKMNLYAEWREKQQTEIDRIRNGIDTWRENLARDIRSISSSDTFRIMFSDIVKLSENDLESYLKGKSEPGSELESIIEQSEYAANILREFAEKFGFTEIRFFSDKGHELLKTGILPKLSDDRKNILQRSDNLSFGRITENKKGVFIDVSEPLFEISAKANPENMGAFFFSAPLNRELETLLAPRKDMRPVIIDRTSHVAFILKGRVIELVSANDQKVSMPFGEREGFNEAKVYSMGRSLEQPEWEIVIETPQNVINDVLEKEKVKIWLTGVALNIGAAMLFTLFILFQSRRAHIRNENSLREINSTILQQKDMLDSINQSINAGIALVSDKGEIKVANRAFQNIFGQQNTLGACSCPELAEKATRAGDQIIEDEITVNDRLYRLGIFPGHDNNRTLVLRDITEYRRRAEKRGKRQDALVRAMEKAIEGVDPDLTGHSAKVGRLALKMAGIMKMSNDSLETLKLASSLSQIGKIFTPQNILNKSGALSDEERNELDKAMKKGGEILKDMDFELPVPEIVAQFNEKNPVLPEAAILFLANSFIAMISKRKWRASMSYDEAIATLSGDARFGKEYILALSNAVKADWEE